MSNTGELPADQSARNAREALRCLGLLSAETGSTFVAGKAIEVERHLQAGRYDEAFELILQCLGTPSNMCPHPAIVAAAEVRNAIRYDRRTK